MTNSHNKFTVQYLPLFWSDLNSAVDYIANVLQNPSAANDLIDNVESGILTHVKCPTAAPIYKTTRKRALPYYWFSVGNYMVFYVVFDNVMEVRRLIYGARDLTKMLP